MLYLARILALWHSFIGLLIYYIPYLNFFFQETPKSGKVGKSGGQENSEHEVGKTQDTLLETSWKTGGICLTKVQMPPILHVYCLKVVCLISDIINKLKPLHYQCPLQ